MSDDLQRVFKAYTKGKEFMVSREFVKVLKDSKLIPKPIALTSADLCFTKLGKTSKRITLPQFEECLNLVAEREKIDIAILLEPISKLEGPILVGTQTEAVRFYDDKSTFTGVHKHGGPKTLDVATAAPDGNQGGGNKATLSSLMNRGAADVRGVPMPRQQ